jgi:protein-tyrosine phosphatase
MTIEAELMARKRHKKLMTNFFNNLNFKEFFPKRLKRGIKLSIRNIFQSIKYYLIDKQITAWPQKIFPSHIVFVCKGNVCRSRFAEERFNLLFGEKVKLIESCGLEVNQGSYPPFNSVCVAAEFSCDLHNKLSKGLSECDLENADLILPMEYEEYKQLVEMFPWKKNNIRLLRQFAPLPFSIFCNIEDPYGWGKSVFRKTYSLIDKALHRLV